MTAYKAGREQRLLFDFNLFAPLPPTGLDYTEQLDKRIWGPWFVLFGKIKKGFENKQANDNFLSVALLAFMVAPYPSSDLYK